VSRPVAALLALAAVLLAAAPAGAQEPAVTSGPLTATLDPATAQVAFGELAAHPDLTVAYRTASGWERATRVVETGPADDGVRAVLATTGGERIRLDLVRAGDGVVALRAEGPPGTSAMRIGFRADARERYLGFGERSNAVDQRGNEVESYVGEGTYQDNERQIITAFVPPWSIRQRDDATYFPMPWLVSTRGFGVLLDNAEVSRFRLAGGGGPADAWSVEVDAPRMFLRVFAGPRPADVVRRLTEAIGRQPEPGAPWMYGPWFQTGQPDDVPEETRYAKILRDADAPVSAAETHRRYLPCGGAESKRDREKERTAFFHANGFATLTYLQEKICTSYTRAYEAARERDALVRNAAGEPYVYPAYIGESTPPTRPMSLIDFTAPRAAELFDLLLREPVEDGHDGWMEDFGESFPPGGRTATGQDERIAHNRYPVDYHRVGHEVAQRAPRPIARFVRSGYTGVHPYAPIVWGGDPTTSWGFDGLASSVKNALSMGLSGISTWGSDIGGYFSLGTNTLTPELLARWIQFGAVSTVMRTKAGGVAVPLKERPQIWEPATLPHWKRWARLHTQLQPYLAAATARYRRTGMPVMAHHALTDPDDERAVAREDQFRFGPDLLAAPVLAPGQTRRDVALPSGRWVDLWRSVDYDERGGGLRLKRGARPRLLTGGREATLPAPLDELPLLARAGTLLALLSPDVDTLADYGEGAEGVVRLADRRDRLELLAFPRGRSSATFNDGERLESAEARRRWRLRVEGDRTRTYRLQASLATLRRPFRPCHVTLGGRPLRSGAWRHDRSTGRLQVTFRARTATLTVRGTGCAKRARGR
jgi:alpha-glucosidase (family GH31 glycosyl hydrolase)